MENAIQSSMSTSGPAQTTPKPATTTRKPKATNLSKLAVIDATRAFQKLTMNDRLPLTTAWFHRLNQSPTLLEDMETLYHEILDLAFEPALTMVDELIGIAQADQLRFLHTQFGQLPPSVKKIEIVLNLWQCSVDGSWGLSAEDTLTGSITRPMFDAVLGSLKAKGTAVRELNKEGFDWTSFCDKKIDTVRVIWATERSPWCQGDMEGGKCDLDTGFTVTNPKLLEIFTVHVNILKVLITKACTGPSGEIVIEPKIVSTLACGSEACKAVGCPSFDPSDPSKAANKTEQPVDCTAAPHQASLSYVLPGYLPKLKNSADDGSTPPIITETTKSFVLYWTTVSMELIAAGFTRFLNVNLTEVLARSFELLNDNDNRFAKALCGYTEEPLSWEEAKAASMEAPEAANVIRPKLMFSSSCIKTLDEQKRLMDTSFWRQAVTMVPGVSTHVPPVRVIAASSDPQQQGLSGVQADVQYLMSSIPKETVKCTKKFFCFKILNVHHRSNWLPSILRS